MIHNQPLKKTTVLSAGSMGHGIAQLMAMTGVDVTLVDINDEILDKARENVQWSVQKLVQKGKVSKNDADKAMAHLHTTTKLNHACENADLIIEAIPENLEIKKELFAQVDKLAPEHGSKLASTYQCLIPIARKSLRLCCSPTVNLNQVPPAPPYRIHDEHTRHQK